MNPATDPVPDDATVTVVSVDSHAGPRLGDQLRPYCPDRFLDDFDRFAEANERSKAEVDAATKRLIGDPRYVRQLDRNQLTGGHNNMAARIADMDADGIAAEVIYHGSANYEPLPFVAVATKERHVPGTFQATAEEAERMAVGYHMYNRWLADAVSHAPGRLIGVAQLPMWDIDAAIAEAHWARQAGLRAVNFPAPRAPLPEYDEPVWEPFWSACEELDLPLASHSGASGWPTTGPQARAVFLVEVGGWLSRRAIHRMVFGGVFERHPGLKLMPTEQMSGWWPGSMSELDSAWKTNRWLLRDQVPRPPSEYCARSVFLGASMLAPFEAEMAVREGYVGNIMWGRDYPHPEGVWQLPGDGTPLDITHQAMRHALSGVAADEVRAILGGNAIAVFGLDARQLAGIAGRINAPTVAELATPLEQLPEMGSPLAFRTAGPWG
jgi:predicted TIM-barrel fold metal-dependent hydrolase